MFKTKKELDGFIALLEKNRAVIPATEENFNPAVQWGAFLEYHNPEVKAVPVGNDGVPTLPIQVDANELINEQVIKTIPAKYLVADPDVTGDFVVVTTCLQEDRTFVGWMFMGDPQTDIPHSPHNFLGNWVAAQLKREKQAAPELDHPSDARPNTSAGEQQELDFDE